MYTLLYSILRSLSLLMLLYELIVLYILFKSLLLCQCGLQWCKAATIKVLLRVRIPLLTAQNFFQLPSLTDKLRRRVCHSMYLFMLRLLYLSNTSSVFALLNIPNIRNILSHPPTLTVNLLTSGNSCHGRISPDKALGLPTGCITEPLVTPRGFQLNCSFMDKVKIIFALLQHVIGVPSSFSSWKFMLSK